MSRVQGGSRPQHGRASKRPNGSDPWLPLLALLGVVVIIVLALAITGTINGLASVLFGLAAVLTALATVIHRLRK